MIRSSVTVMIRVPLCRQRLFLLPYTKVIFQFTGSWAGSSEMFVIIISFAQLCQRFRRNLSLAERSRRSLGGATGR